MVPTNLYLTCNLVLLTLSRKLKISIICHVTIGWDHGHVVLLDHVVISPSLHFTSCHETNFAKWYLMRFMNDILSIISELKQWSNDQHPLQLLMRFCWIMEFYDYTYSGLCETVRLITKSHPIIFRFGTQTLDICWQSGSHQMEIMICVILVLHVVSLGKR